MPVAYSKKVTFTLLGTGTSQGVPVIGCDCEVCTSPNTKDQRLRSAALISDGNTNIVIDTGPDFRQQMLRSQVNRLAGVLYTHEHNDHVIGLDDVRPFNFRQQSPMALYATERVLGELKKRFYYAFDPNPYPGSPVIDLFEIYKNEPFNIAGIPIIPIEVMHGNMPVLGFRIGDLTYITDAKTIADEELDKVRGSRTLILNALHHKKHHSHLNLREALEMIDIIKPESAYLIHISHNMGLSEVVNPTLPKDVQLAYDNLQLEVELVSE